MEKYLIFLLLLLIPISVFSDGSFVAVEHPASAIGVTTPDIICGVSGLAADGCDDCSGTLKFAWHFENNVDVTEGTPCGCSDGDETGTATGSPTFSSAASPPDGTYAGLLNSASAEYWSFDISSRDILDLDDFKITFSIYVDTATVANAYVMRSYADATNYLFVTLQTNNYLRFWVNGVNIYSADALSVDTWYDVEWQAKQGVDGNDHYVNISGGIGANEEDEDYPDSDNHPTVLQLGSYDASDEPDYHLDNIKIYPSDRY